MIYKVKRKETTMQTSHMEEPHTRFLKTLWTQMMYLDAVR